MKNIFGLVLAIGLLAVNTFAADQTTAAGAGKTSLLTGKTKVNSISVYNGSGGAALVHIFDAPGTSVVYTNAAYTVVGNTVPAASVTTYTNIFGTVENWTNSAVTTATTTTSSSTSVAYPKLVQFSIADGATATFTPSSPTYTSFGLLASNTAAVTIQLNYNR